MKPSVNRLRTCVVACALAWVAVAPACANSAAVAPREPQSRGPIPLAEAQGHFAERGKDQAVLLAALVQVVEGKSLQPHEEDTFKNATASPGLRRFEDVDAGGGFSLHPVSEASLPEKLGIRVPNDPVPTAHAAAAMEIASLPAQDIDCGDPRPKIAELASKFGDAAGMDWLAFDFQPAWKFLEL